MDVVVFRLCDKAPDFLREVCLERGWEEYNEDHLEESGDWNLWWKTQGFTTSEYKNCRPWQRLNHFPKSTKITKKDGLARNLRRMKTSYGGSIFNFFPRTFILPNEYKKFVSEFSREDGDKRSNYWICKPTEQSCGRGIFIFKDLHDLTYDCAVVVQKYVIKPFLISGYKFDLRLYAIVTSFHPFQLYIYHEGIVRFSTEKFDLSSLDNHFSHLTNTTINKSGPQYSTEKESIGVGCKWTLSQFRLYLHKHNIDDQVLWHRITSIIIITLLSQVQDVPSDSYNCFELFGFDVLIDEKLKPWLLEVNFSPALGNDCTQDELVKRPLLNDILEIVDFSEADIKRGRKEKETTATRRKCRGVVHSVPRSNFKSYNSNMNDIICRKNSKISLALSQGEEETECRDVKESGKNHVTHVGNTKMRSKNQKHKCPVSGANTVKTIKSYQECKTPCLKHTLCSNKKLSSSEEFIKAASSDDCDGQTSSGYDKINITLSCASESDFKSNSGYVLEAENENGQSLCLEEMEEGEKGHGKAHTRRALELARPQSVIKGKALDPSSGFSRPKRSELPPHCYLRRYNSEASLLNGIQHSGNLHHSTSKYFPRVPTAVRSAHKTSCSLKPRIGNCILAFPFNEATLKASQGTMDLKIVIEEIRKILRLVRNHVKSSPLELSDDGSNSLDLSKPFWGYRSMVNTFYSSLEP